MDISIVAELAHAREFEDIPPGKLCMLVHPRYRSGSFWVNLVHC